MSTENNRQNKGLHPARLPRECFRDRSQRMHCTTPSQQSCCHFATWRRSTHAPIPYYRAVSSPTKLETADFEATRLSLPCESSAWQRWRTKVAAHRAWIQLSRDSRSSIESMGTACAPGTNRDLRCDRSHVGAKPLAVLRLLCGKVATSPLSHTTHVSWLFSPPGGLLSPLR